MIFLLQPQQLFDCFFFFQAEDGIRDGHVTGVQTCALPIFESTGTTGFGAFAGIHPLDARRLLVASMDSIGTKTIVARARGALRVCGADMAAHCINDVITTGADPLLLLDYVASSNVNLDDVADLVEGAAEVCRAAGVALIGGETAEM